MRINRIGVALQVTLKALLALALAVGASFLLRLAGSMAMLTALLVLLTLFFFAALTLLRALPAVRYPLFNRGFNPGYRPGDQGWRPPRGPRPGWPPRGPDGRGGVREPRRPFPPGMPPRAVAAEPESAEAQS